MKTVSNKPYWNNRMKFLTDLNLGLIMKANTDLNVINFIGIGLANNSFLTVSSFNSAGALRSSFLQKRLVLDEKL